jgi:hypothetical protein
VVDYDYCPPVSLVGGSAISPSSATGGSPSTVSVGSSVTPSAAGSCSTVIVNDSCVVCRNYLSELEWLNLAKEALPRPSHAEYRLGNVTEKGLQDRRSRQDRT